MLVCYEENKLGKVTFYLSNAYMKYIPTDVAMNCHNLVIQKVHYVQQVLSQK